MQNGTASNCSGRVPAWTRAVELYDETGNNLRSIVHEKAIYVRYEFSNTRVLRMQSRSEGTEHFYSVYASFIIREDLHLSAFQRCTSHSLTPELREIQKNR